MFIKIDPHGKEFSMILTLALGIGDVVAHGGTTSTCNYVAKIASLQLPAEKYHPQIIQQSATMMTNLPLSSADLTSCNE
jgi:hypothetical protein